MAHAKPSPRKTLTELEPVTLVIAASAVGSCCVANLEAKVSGKEVPNATKVMAVTSFRRPTMQPKRLARSEINAVVMPTHASAYTKVPHPLNAEVGGARQLKNDHGKRIMYMLSVYAVKSSPHGGNL
jgi:hypothetical protein